MVTKSDGFLKFLCVLFSLVFYGGLAAGMFWLAGTWNLPFLWAVFFLQGGISLLGVQFLDPELIRERFRPAGKDLDPWGRPVLTVLLLGMYGVAALDVGRWHLSDNVPFLLQLLALLLQLPAWVGFLWAMKVNKFFSSAIRLQSDRGQEVITGGPYNWVRHPGYAFGSLALFGQGLAFGSWLSLVPGGLIVSYLVHRTMMEERLLKEKLAGYEEYSRQVRFRWLPGVW